MCEISLSFIIKRLIYLVSRDTRVVMYEQSESIAPEIILS